MDRRSLLALLAVTLGGCRACKNDHPYVPAEPDAQVAASPDAGSVRVSSIDAGIEPALGLPAGTTTWRGDGLSIDGGTQEVALVLARDFDGDGKTDALAVLRPPPPERKPGSSTGRLVFVHGGDAGRPPAAVAVGPELGADCFPSVRLERIGPRSAFAEIGSTCPKTAGSRAIAVVRLGTPAPSIAFDAVLVDPREAPKLAVDAEVADRDGDGVDDAVLHLTLDGEGGTPPLEARLAFFDRPAGPSRDPEEPEASFKAIATRISSAKTKSKEMPGLVDQMRALYRAICEEGGAPRITRVHGGAAPTCGTSKALEDAGVANIRALAQTGDVIGAFFAADVAQVAPATKTASKNFEIEKYLSIAAPVETAKSVKALDVKADVPADRPEWGPLAFDPSGRLLVRNGGTVTSVDPESGEAKPDATAAWPFAVLSPDGKRRWTDAAQVCEGAPFRATFTTLDTNATLEAGLPFPQRFGRCHGEPASVQAIAWGPRGLEAIIAGRAVLLKEEGANEIKASPLDAFLDERGPLGSPRNGAKMALALPNALLVRADAKWLNLRSPEYKPSELRSCVIDDGGTRIACMRRGKAILIQR